MRFLPTHSTRFCVMLFDSVTYYLFLAGVLILFFSMPWRFSRWMLVAASYLFYSAAEIWYCLILLGSTSVDFIVARKLFSSPTQHRKRWLWISVISNLSILGLFKYVDFASSNLNLFFSTLGWQTLPTLSWVLPVGISFYTFQTLSYTIDVYRGKTEPTRDFGGFALYVSFFPQLVAGPIERAGKLLPQLLERQKVTVEDLKIGFERILWGLVKKTVFADRLAIMVNQVFAQPQAYSSTELMVATAAFSFQLYLDFSAYTDIATGSARMMGIRLSRNFNYPFIAVTPSDFWARWHISLTTWFRDYVYQPLGGTRRHNAARTIFNVLLVMGVMGLWHGAAWHYVAFGLVSGLVLLGYMALRRLSGGRHLLGSGWWSLPLNIIIGNVVIFSIMVFFRAPTLSDVGHVFAGIFDFTWSWRDRYNSTLVVLVIAWTAHVVRGFGWHKRLGLECVNFGSLPRALFWTLLLMMILFGAVERSQEFIYFQF